MKFATTITKSDGIFGLVIDKREHMNDGRTKTTPLSEIPAILPLAVRTVGDKRVNLNRDNCRAGRDNENSRITARRPGERDWCLINERRKPISHNDNRTLSTGIVARCLICISSGFFPVAYRILSKWEVSSAK